MVAASKLRRAQETVVATRPFAREARRVLASIARRVDQTSASAADQAARRGHGRRRCSSSSRRIAASAAASTPTSSRRRARSCARTPGRPVSLGLVGRKGRDLLAAAGFPCGSSTSTCRRTSCSPKRRRSAAPAIDGLHRRQGGQRPPDLQRVQVGDAAEARGRAAAAAGDRSSGRSRPRARRRPTTSTSRRRSGSSIELLRRLVEAQVLRALLESNAAFYAAQMTAMDAATRNSADMIEGLTLTMNKMRQAAITREIIEVVSGAQAL